MKDDMSQNICPNCGGKLEEGKSFCPACGKLLKADSAPAKQGNLRDVVIIMGALVIIFVAYLIFSQKPEQTKPPMPTSSEEMAANKDFKHPPISGMAGGAYPEYDKVIASLPTGYDSLVQLGNHFMDNQVFPLAIECYQRAIKLDSLNPDVITDLGASYYAMGDVDKAVAQFQKAIAINPNHAIALFNLGISYRGQNDFDKAKYYWGKYLEVAPNSPLSDTVKKYISDMDLK